MSLSRLRLDVSYDDPGWHSEQRLIGSPLERQATHPDILDTFCLNECILNIPGEGDHTSAQVNAGGTVVAATSSPLPSSDDRGDSRGWAYPHSASQLSGLMYLGLLTVSCSVLHHFIPPS